MALIAGTVDVAVLLRTLALQRPVYHSEADFQHAFAWESTGPTPASGCGWRPIRSPTSDWTCFLVDLISDFTLLSN